MTQGFIWGQNCDHGTIQSVFQKKNTETCFKDVLHRSPDLRAIPFEILRGGELENLTDPRPTFYFFRRCPPHFSGQRPPMHFIFFSERPATHFYF